jgi:toxin ParE1/3/4
VAYKLIWSPISRDDLHNIVRFISRDSPARAQAFALRLIARSDMLQEQPEMGRVVPEYRLTHIREIIFRPYRIVYRVDHGARRVEIARVWHAARGTPLLP